MATSDLSMKLKLDTADFDAQIKRAVDALANVESDAADARADRLLAERLAYAAVGLMVGLVLGLVLSGVR